MEIEEEPVGTAGPSLLPEDPFHTAEQRQLQEKARPLSSSNPSRLLRPCSRRNGDSYKRVATAINDASDTSRHRRKICHRNTCAKSSKSAPSSLLVGLSDGCVRSCRITEIWRRVSFAMTSACIWVLSSSSRMPFTSSWRTCRCHGNRYSAAAVTSRHIISHSNHSC